MKSKIDEFSRAFVNENDTRIQWLEDRLNDGTGGISFSLLENDGRFGLFIGDDKLAMGSGDTLLEAIEDAEIYWNWKKEKKSAKQTVSYDDLHDLQGLLAEALNVPVSDDVSLTTIVRLSKDLAKRSIGDDASSKSDVEYICGNCGRYVSGDRAAERIRWTECGKCMPLVHIPSEQ